MIRPWAGELLSHNVIRAGDLYVLHSVLSGSWAYSGSYSMGTDCPVPVGTAMEQEADCTPPPNAKFMNEHPLRPSWHA